MACCLPGIPRASFMLRICSAPSVAPCTKGRTAVHAEPGYLEHLATNRYFDRTFGCDAVKVLPGEYFVTTSDIVLVTVLGSCVTACVRDRDKGLGGMNHFMLPDNGGETNVLSSSA